MKWSKGNVRPMPADFQPVIRQSMSGEEGSAIRLYEEIFMGETIALGYKLTDTNLRDEDLRRAVWCMREMIRLGRVEEIR